MKSSIIPQRLADNLTKVKSKEATAWNHKKYKALYLLSIPGILYFIIFKYIPLFGLIIAFKESNIFRSIWTTRFVGLQHFEKFLQYPEFWNIFKNTLIIAFYDVLFSFPAPIILALLLNEVRLVAFKRTIQTIVYLPHFLSWVIVGGIFITALSPTTGFVNQVRALMGYEPVYFMAEIQYIRAIIIGTGIWKEVGWATIIFLAAIITIDPCLYESAIIDGANRFKQTIYITLPSISTTVIVMFLLRIGRFMEFGFERVYVFMNGFNREYLDIFATYIYRVGLQNAQFAYTTAIGIFQSILGLILLVSANRISKKITGKGLY